MPRLPPCTFHSPQSLKAEKTSTVNGELQRQESTVKRAAFYFISGGFASFAYIDICRDFYSAAAYFIEEMELPSATYLICV